MPSPKRATPHSPENVRGTDINGKAVVLAKTQPQQLALFQTFFPDDHNDHYSNTIELYDAIPKYVTNPKLVDAMREGGKYLPLLERRFQHRGEVFTVTIRPARLKDREGREKEYYPSPREELVEEALRKLACDRLNGVYLDNLVGVQFTLYELKQELRNRGHDIHLQSLIEALKICHGVDLHMYRKDGSVMLASPIFPLLLIGSRQDWLKNPTETRCYVQFHPFITQCLSQLTYRQFDYGMYMRYRYRLSRWLHKRLAHNYVQASMLTPYTIRLSTILRDSGTQESAQNYNNPRSVERALDELHDEKILLAITKETLRGPRKRLVDIKYTLLPTVEFVTEIKRANRRTTILTERLQSVATHSNQDIGDAEEEVPRKIGDAEEEVLLENR